jgi:CHAT domain-containing protein
VIKGLKECSWVHFACHGIQEVSHPTESSLLLAGNSRLTLADIIKLSLMQADFAFLSACQTAAGTEELSEEAIHLAAGMLLAGYRGIIATTWSIMDSVAPQIADATYAHLLKEPRPDHLQAARALHFAIRRLRESRADLSFFAWVPFIHIGA